jgi:hypothetical protein
MTEVPRWFPKDIEELYRPEPGDIPSLNDPRVAPRRSWMPPSPTA